MKKWIWLMLLVFVSLTVIVIWTWCGIREKAHHGASTEMGGHLHSSGSTNGVESNEDSGVGSFLSGFSAPIVFYGKVIDQRGNPVAGASILLLPVDSFGEESRNRRTIKSDTEGRFSVEGLKGLAMSVQVKKDGYLDLPDLGFDRPASSRMIEYGLANDGGSRFKDPSNPTLFILHEIGPVDPMVHVERKRWKLPVDGSPVRIALDSEDGSGSHWIEFCFKSGWNQLPSGKRFGVLFDWRLEMRIPGGGFLNNDSDYNFEAPENGYVENLVIEYTAAMPSTWRVAAHRRLFVRFADNTYGRIQFSIDGASDRRPLYMTSWMNLVPGSRNLASPHLDGFGMPED